MAAAAKVYRRRGPGGQMRRAQRAAGCPPRDGRPPPGVGVGGIDVQDQDIAGLQTQVLGPRQVGAVVTMFACPRG